MKNILIAILFAGLVATSVHCIRLKIALAEGQEIWRKQQTEMTDFLLENSAEFMIVQTYRSRLEYAYDSLKNLGINKNEYFLGGEE